MSFMIGKEIDFDSMCEEFIEKYFSGKNVSYDVGYYDEHLGTPNYREEVMVQIMFDDYKWVDGLGREQSESVMICYDNKNLQPFYIDGKFEAREVYEAHTWSYPQKHDKIYQYDKDELRVMWDSFMVNC